MALKGYYPSNSVHLIVRLFLECILNLCHYSEILFELNFVEVENSM